MEVVEQSGVMIFMTHGGDGEGSDAVFGQVLSLFESYLYIAIGSGAIGWPILLTFPLRERERKRQGRNGKQKQFLSEGGY